MEDYIANEVAAYPTLANQVVLEVFQYLILLLVGGIALVTMSALLVAIAGLIWQGLQSMPASVSSPRTARCKPTTRRFAMKKIVHPTLLFFCALFACALTAQAQTPERATTNGPVWRIAEYRAKPGKGADYMKYLREHAMPQLEEWKRQGLILDYKFFHNDTTGGPQEVQYVQAILYRNYAEAMDSDDEARIKKFQEISLKIFGSAENRTKVLDQLQTMRELLRGYILHEMKINPLKPATGSGN